MRGRRRELRPTEEVYRKALADEFVKWQADYQEVKSLGGLHVLGTERHEARRIDNQLRGRSGRQGDPGLPGSTSPWTTISCGCSAERTSRGSCPAWG